MKPSLQKLFNIFKLEAENNYDNKAVIGGLDRIIDSWEAEARSDGLPEDLVHAVASNLRNYPRITGISRAEVLEGVWRRVQRDIGVTQRIEFKPSTSTPNPVNNSLIHSDVDVIDETTVSTVEQTVPVASEHKTEAVKQPVALEAPVTVLQGVGPKHATTLKRLGIETLRDVLYDFPRRYDDYTQLKTINRLHYGDEVTVIGTLKSFNQRRGREAKRQIIEGILDDGSGAIRLTWFNQPWIIKRLHVGTPYAVSGKIDQYLGRLTLNNPEPEQLDQLMLSNKRIVPVYKLSGQITQRWMRKVINQVVTYWAPKVTDPLPNRVRESANLVDISTALLQAHYPDSWEQLQAAKQRLAFDEIFLLQIGVQKQRLAWQSETASRFEVSDEWIAGIVEKLPFRLTNAQLRTLEEARQDLASGRPMNRLLEGDVGSGKTIIAALVIAMITHSGAQAALMAPTGILAEQHYQSLKKILSQPSPYADPTNATSMMDDDDHDGKPVDLSLKDEEIRLLLGSTPENEKEQIRQGLENGAIRLVIGTHALIENPVVFSNLELVIIDEQHRFGVDQRSALRAKGHNPHLLVMTATPIPRSLALTIYGDLDLSILDELPPGRKTISTHILTPLDRERAYNLIHKQVEMGLQAFIVYPFIEENEYDSNMSAVEEHSKLQSEIFPHIQVGLLHGRMKSDEKEEVMKRFRDGDYQILVSTTVVEVGVDIPKASVMLIEGANRFGLAQLHQLRGRVGRAADKSYCFLIPDSADAIENERLQAMLVTNDGFVLAEKDLDQRGPGEFFGTRQSGYPLFKFANIMDVQLIEQACQQAQKLIEQDSELSLPENQPLVGELEHFWNGIRGDIS
jgi:ATP-dependent DNA helicase RecG